MSLPDTVPGRHTWEISDYLYQLNNIHYISELTMTTKLLCTGSARCIPWVLLASISTPSFAFAEERTWTSRDKRFTVRAELVDYSDDDIRLQNSDGKRVTVPLDKISKADIGYLRKSTKNYYRIPGMLRICNVKRGLRWEVLERSKQNDRETATISTGLDLLSEYGLAANLTLIPLIKVPSRQECEVIAKDLNQKYRTELSTSLGSQFNLTPRGFTTVETEGKEIFFQSTFLVERVTGGELYAAAEIRFLEDNALLLSFLSKEPDPLEKYKRVGASLTIEDVE